VHQPRDEPLQELALAEDDLDLVLHAHGHVGRTVVRVGRPDLRGEEGGAPPRARTDEGKRDGEDDGAYVPRTLLSSALIAGTISCRSPMTA
jgi:hypothetical protein